jgi:hypothetical protein
MTARHRSLLLSKWFGIVPEEAPSKLKLASSGLQRDGGPDTLLYRRASTLIIIRQIITTLTILSVEQTSSLILFPEQDGQLSPAKPPANGRNRCRHAVSDVRLRSPASICSQLKMQGHVTDVDIKSGIASTTIYDRQRTSQDIVFPCIVSRGMLYSSPLFVPTEAEHSHPLPAPSLYGSWHPSPSEKIATPHDVSQVFYDSTKPEIYDVHHVARDTLRILWHQRLGHANSRRISNAHKTIKGVPKVPFASDIDKCPICLSMKMRRKARGHDTTRSATTCFQGLSIDFAFIVQQSKDSERLEEYTGLQGQTCYVLVADHFSGGVHGITQVSKEPPIVWLDAFLARNKPNVPNRYICMDQGGELGRCPEIKAVCDKHGYTIHQTGTEAHHQNGPVERPNSTIADALRSMLEGSAQPAKFWPYAFDHYLRIYNSFPVGEHDESPTSICNQHQDDFANLRTWGCRVWVKKNHNRPAKLAKHASKGIFLGYAPDTSKNIIWYDLETRKVKLAYHVDVIYIYTY